MVRDKVINGDISEDEARQVLGCVIWPTPTTQEVEHPEMELTSTGRRKTRDGKGSHSIGLSDAVMIWPTPMVSTRECTPEQYAARRKKYGGAPRATYLQDAVKYWPTPSAMEGAHVKSYLRSSETWEDTSCQTARILGLHYKLSGKDARPVFPTPTQSDHKGSGPIGTKSQANMKAHGHLAATVATGQLNPDWVEFYLMGWWRGWSSPEPLISEEMKTYGKRIQTLSANKGRSKSVSSVRKNDEPEEIWRSSRRCNCVQAAEILRREMHGSASNKGCAEKISTLKKSSQIQEKELRDVRNTKEIASSSSERGYCAQCSGQYHDVVRLLSYEMALEQWENYAEETVGLLNLWNASSRFGVLSKTLNSLQEIWQSLDDKEKDWLIVYTCSGSVWSAEPPIPRVTTDTKNRAHRLKAIGNGQVPLCMATAWLMLTGVICVSDR